MTDTKNKKTLNFNSIRDTIVNNKIEAIIICLVFLFYTFMMIFRLTYSPLWFDEHVEHEISQMSLTDGEMYSNIIITFQPPLYNFVMHFWLMVSQSDLWFRLFNVLLGIITGAAVYGTIRKMYGYKPASISVILLSVCYQYIYCIQECSEYQLMVMNIALAIFYYVKASEDEKIISELLFVLFSVAAMYSQYGAMFMVVPLLSVYYLKQLFFKNTKVLVPLTVIYGIAAVCGALPLYILYASKQLAENAISEHSSAAFGLKDLMYLFTEPGLIIGYLYNIPQKTVITVLLSVLSLILLAACVLLIIRFFKNKTEVPSDIIKADLLLIFLTGYVLHYFLVVFRIYAMIHPGESAGFFARYSYFYFPLMAISITVISVELKRLFIDNRGINTRKINTVIITVFALVSVCFFVPRIMKNWHKSYDDLFCATWITNRGWEEHTYLIGQARLGFDRYIKDVYGDAAAANAFHESQMNLDYLPESFWLWRMSWGGEKFDDYVAEIRMRGYDVDVMFDYGTEGQLAHAVKH